MKTLKVSVNEDEAHTVRYALMLRLDNLQNTYKNDEVADHEVKIIERIVSDLDNYLGDQ